MYNVDGFLFEDETTAELAKKEEEGIRFIKERTALDHPEVVYKLYTKLLDEKLFVTPVGIRFMSELQKILLTSLQVSCDQIPPIPVSFMVLRAESEEIVKVEETVAAENDAEADKNASIENDAMTETDTGGEAEKAKKAAKKRNDKKRADKAEDRYKKPFYVAVFFAMIFAFSIAGMFAITELSGNNVNILNYRNEILNEYSTWEAQLKEKEAELKEWEEELEAREQN